jgi:hypothetical protein
VKVSFYIIRALLLLVVKASRAAHGFCACSTIQCDDKSSNSKPRFLHSHSPSFVQLPLPVLTRVTNSIRLKACKEYYTSLSNMGPHNVTVRCREFSLNITLLRISSERATSHMGLRAHDHLTSSNLIHGKGGAGRSLLQTALEGPTEYVNASWM